MKNSFQFLATEGGGVANLNLNARNSLGIIAYAGSEGSDEPVQPQSFA